PRLGGQLRGSRAATSSAASPCFRTTWYSVFRRITTSIKPALRSARLEGGGSWGNQGLLYVFLGCGRVERVAVLAVLECAVVPGDVDRPALPDHGHLHLTRVLQLILDLARDLMGQKCRRVVVELARADDDAD